MSGDLERGGDRFFGSFPAEWGVPVGAPFSAVRESWIWAQVRKRMAWSGQDALDWLARRQYDRAFREVSSRSDDLA